MQDDDKLGPEDDFEDDLDFADDFDDGEFDDELSADSSVGGGDDWDEFQENNDPLEGLDDLPKVKKKSKININLLVIGGVVLVGAGVLASQFMSQKSSVPQPPAQQQETQDVAQTAPTEQPKPAKSVVISPNGTIDGVFELPEEVEDFDAQGSDNEGFLYDPDILQEAQVSLDDSPPMPSAMVEDTSGDDGMDALDEFTEMLDPDPNPVPTPSPSVVMPSIDTAATSLDDMDDFDLPTDNVALDADPLPTTSTMAEMATKATNKTETMSASVAKGTLEEKLDSILSRLEKMEQKISKVESGSVVNVDERIATLQKKIDAMNSGSSRTSSVKKASASPKKSTTRKRAAPKKAAARTVWELRSAQPGKAWVSKKGQSSVQEVSVGENLSGIGRITSIAPIQGKWVVQGSSGSIKQ